MKRKILPLLMLSCLCGFTLKAQNFGFEASVSTPPLNWTAVTGTWQTDTVVARTGKNCMRITDPATTGTTIGNTSMFANVPTANTHFLITMAWARSNVMNGVLYLGHRNATGTNTINPNVATAGQPINMDTGAYRRIISVSSGTITTPGNYSVGMRAFRSTNITGTTIFIDDAIIYASTTNVPDTVAPRVPGATIVTIATNNILSWVYNGDSGAVSSGIAGAVVLRTTGSVTDAPILNPQAKYATVTGASGVSSFIQNTNLWEVIGVVGAGVTTFTDLTSDPLVTYTYAISVFDTARNYSPAMFAIPQAPAPMQFDSINVFSVNNTYRAGSSSSNVLGIRIYTNGTLNRLPITSFNLGIGSTPAGSINRARVFYTGNSSLFDTTNLFGVDTNPGATFIITGLDTLLPTVNYFWVAYDISDTVQNCAQLDATCNAAMIDGVSRPVAIANPIGNSIARQKMQGDYTIDNNSITSCALSNYNTFQEAINDLQLLGNIGNVRFLVPAGSVFVSNPIFISNLSNGSDTIFFMRTGIGANPIVYGINGGGNTDAVFTLQGVSRIVIDGIDARDTSINTTQPPQMEYGFRVIAATPERGSSFNVIKNALISLNRANTATIGLLQSAATTGGGLVPVSLSGANHSNTYINLKLTNSYGGFQLLGNSLFPDSGCVITSEGADSTIVGSMLVANDIGNGISPLIYGIMAVNQRNVEISRSSVRNLAITGTLTLQGIYLNNIAADADYGTARIFNNRVFNLNRINTSVLGSMHGIRIDVSESASADIYNNEVFNMVSSNATSVTANVVMRGISHCVSGNGNARYFNNSVSINSGLAVAISSAAFWKGGTGSVEIVNNIFSNTTPNQTGVAFHAASLINAGTVSNASTNIYWAPNDSGFVGIIGTVNYTNLNRFRADLATASDLQQIDQGSMNLNPQFVSSGVLDIQFPNSATRSALPIPFITEDINRATRNSLNPTIGAYENAQTFIDNSGPIISDVNIINGSNPIVRANIRDNGQLLPSQISLWYRLGNTGIFIQALPDSTPASINGQYQWSLAFNMLSNGIYQFYITARDTVAPGTNIGVWPIFNPSFTAFSSTDPPNYDINPSTSARTATFNKTAILPAGTYTIGVGGDYTNLSAVADALRSNELTGNVTFEFISSYDGINNEVFPIEFNQLIRGNSSYTVTIRPATGVTNVVTSGDPGTGNAVILFNNASGFILDGRPGGAGTAREWTIRNRRALTVHGAVIQFINGSQFDTIRYLNIQQLSTNTINGSVFISTSNRGVGNKHLVIEHNRIGARTDTTAVSPANALYAAGTTGAINDSNIIRHNEFYDFNTNGIFIATTGNGGAWRIQNNHFYMTNLRSTIQTAIRHVAGVASVHNRIDSNYIGGSMPFASGTPWANTGNVAWRGMVLTIGTTDSNIVQNNVIANLNLSGTATGSFVGIESTSGFNVFTGNHIGSANSNSIQTNTLGVQIGIWINGANNISHIAQNMIRNITSFGATSAVGVNGIRITSAIVGEPLRIVGNTIRNITAANPTVSSTTASLVGILSLYAGTNQDISGNIISNLHNSNTTAATSVLGINISNASSIGQISRNEIYGISNPSQIANALAAGIQINLAGAWLVHNNMVAMGYNITNDVDLRGIVDLSAASNNRYIYNTIVISGTAATTPANLPTYAFMRTSSAVVNVRNNIFVNTRLGSATHYAIANTNVAPAAGWQSNHNNIFNFALTNVARWGTSNLDLAGWVAVSGFDSNSVSVLTSHLADSNLRLSGTSIGNLQLSARPFAGINTDIDGELRDPLFPYMGADENTANPLPVSLTYFNAQKRGDDVLLKWNTSSEINASHFEVEVSTNMVEFTKLNRIKAKGNSSRMQTYELAHANARNVGDMLYYRLKMVDKDGSFTYSKVLSVLWNEAAMMQITAMPNPFVEYIELQGIEMPTYYVVYDMNGRELNSGTISPGQSRVETSNWNVEGVCYIKLVNANQSKVIKLIKQQ